MSPPQGAKGLANNFQNHNITIQGNRIDNSFKQLADVTREGRDEIAAKLERRTGPCALPSMMGT
jgi:hypothetical protein